MSNSSSSKHPSVLQLPNDYVKLKGSERRPSPTAELLGPADPNEAVKVTIALRRRPGGPPFPDFDYFAKTPPSRRQRLPEIEFAEKYGADSNDINHIVQFAQAHGLTIVGTHAGRRTIVVSGTVALMNLAFAVNLGRYKHQVTRVRGKEPQFETYRGRDGFIYVPKDISAIVVGVFGLDNRNITKRASGGDPASTNPLTVPQVAALYQFPTNSAAGQNIAVFSEAGYEPADLQSYYDDLPASYRSQYGMPTVTPIAVDAINGPADIETTQDICIAFSAAPGTNISVYFTTFDQVGWFDLIHRVVHPDSGDAICSVLTTSYYVANGDDAPQLKAEGISLGWINAVHAALEDAALQGVTFCVCSGDYGVDMSDAGPSGSDGKQHVVYPASDPLALGCGGTTVGNVSGSSFAEYVWNDSANIGTEGFTFYGASGGGVSNLYPKPSYQQNAGVPSCLNGGNIGRGVPDVAFNASWNSGYYPIYCVNAANSGYPNPYNGNGTSASAPLCAGLIAVINAKLGYSVGYLNPTLYSLGGTVCRDVNPYATNPPSGPLNNSPANGNNVTGYMAGPGWDPCTGWGSIIGTALLNALQLGSEKACYFILDWQTFIQQGVSEMLTQSNPAVFQPAFYVVVDGFTAADLGIGTTQPVQPAIGYLPSQPIDIIVTPAGPATADPTVPLRFTFAYNMSFTGVSDFPASAGVDTITLTASVTGANTQDNVNATAPIALTAQSGPYMLPGSVSWLSNDIRVFQMETGQSPGWLTDLNQGSLYLLSNPISLGNTGNPTADATAFIQSLIQGFNQLANHPPPDHPFDGIATGEDASALDISQIDPSTNNPVYNFAVARVRYQDLGADAENVRVFFRTFPALAISTAYEQTTTYRRWSDNVEFGSCISLLGTQYDTSLGEQLETVPFFAEPRVDATQASMDTQTDAPNVQTLLHDPGGATVYAYYGCWLDINQPEQALYPQTPSGDGPFTNTASDPLVPILSLLANQHQCITAEIAFDPIPIPTGATPGSSSMLGQRNLSLVMTANPGESASRLVSSPFQMKSTPLDLPIGVRPDELMIDWGNMPTGSVATLYLPDASGAEIIRQATRLYGPSNLTLVDAHTLRFAAQGIAYLPIPVNAGVDLTALLSVELPFGIRKGQQYNAIVRQITSGLAQAVGNRAKAQSSLEWRRVFGSFQLTIPVMKAAEMLAREERLLSILRWIAVEPPKNSRWARVFTRYLNEIGARVQALGGDPAVVTAAPTGAWQRPSSDGGRRSGHKQSLEVTGKVVGILFDGVGEFEGFVLETEEGQEKSFHGREARVEQLIDRAWAEGMVITVCANVSMPQRPRSILYRRDQTLRC